MPSTRSEPSRNMRPIITLSVLAVLVAICLVVLSLYERIADSGEAGLVAELEKQAEALQPQLPKKVNDTITVNGVGVKGTTIIYDVILSSDVDQSQLDNKSLKDPIVESLCLDEDSRALLDMGATFEYDYHNASYETLYSRLTVTKGDC